MNYLELSKVYDAKAELIAATLGPDDLPSDRFMAMLDLRERAQDLRIAHNQELERVKKNEFEFEMRRQLVELERRKVDALQHLEMYASKYIVITERMQESVGRLADTQRKLLELQFALPPGPQVKNEPSEPPTS